MVSSAQRSKILERYLNHISVDSNCRNTTLLHAWLATHFSQIPIIRFIFRIETRFFFYLPFFQYLVRMNEGIGSKCENTSNNFTSCSVSYAFCAQVGI